MKKRIFVLGLALTLSTFGAKADTLYCSFTEPFYSITVHPDGKVILSQPDWGRDPSRDSIETLLASKATVRMKELKKISPVAHIPVYSVHDGKNEIMTLELSYQGSDGMSDNIYPYDAKVRLSGKEFPDGGYSGDLYGGCVSDQLKLIRRD